MTQPLLQVTDLRIGFPMAEGPLVIVDGVSLTVAKGEILGIVGESGSGKSMLALSLMGLLPDGGQVLGGSMQLDGTDLLALTDRQWQRLRGGRLGMVFQDPMTGLNPVRSIGALLSESIRRHTRAGRTEALDVAEAALKAVGIPAARERLAAFPHQLSGGLRQRVMIALALVNHPDVIIADEPTTALDATIQAQILDVLRDRLGDAGGIMITHDLGVAAAICDRIAVMYHGRIVEVGPAAEVLASPVHPYTAGLLAAVPRFTGRGTRLVPIPGTPPKPMDDRHACSFRARCRGAGAACDQAPPLRARGTRRQAACHHPIERPGS